MCLKQLKCKFSLFNQMLLIFCCYVFELDKLQRRCLEFHVLHYGSYASSILVFVDILFQIVICLCMQYV
jgi:hypothetical protein